MSALSIRLRSHRLRVLTLATAGVLALGLAAASQARAAGGLPSSTTLDVSPQSSTAGTAVTLTATIKVLGLNGLGITPTGTVSFTASNSSGSTVALGTAAVGSCLLTTCTATLTTTYVPIGTVTAGASYSGDNLVAPSSGSHALTVTQPTNPGSSSVVTCYAGQPCDTGTVTSGDSTTALDVKTAASSSPQTLSGSLGSGTLHCSEPTDPNDGPPPGDRDDDDGMYVGALATFTSSAQDVTKTVTYTGTGTTGATMKDQLIEHPTHAGCYGSPTAFKGFTNGTYGYAPLNKTDGLYEAILGTCTYTHNVLPCMKGVAGSGTTYSYVVTGSAGDPKIIG